MSGELRMSREQMPDLGRKASELVAERIGSSPRERARDGEFRHLHEDDLLEVPPKDGRPADDAGGGVTRDVSPLTARPGHPVCSRFIPTSPTWLGAMADIMAEDYNINRRRWPFASGPSQLDLVVSDRIRRWFGYPECADGFITSGWSDTSVNAVVAARDAAGRPERATVYTSDQSRSAPARAATIVGVCCGLIRKTRERIHRQARERLQLAVYWREHHGISEEG